METFFSDRVINANNVFNSSYIDAKMLYLYYFNTLPSTNFINQVDGEKAFKEIKRTYSNSIENVYQTEWYKKRKKQYELDQTVLVLNSKCILDIENSCCEIFHDGKQPELLASLTNIIQKYKKRERRDPLEINLIMQNRGSIELKPMEIKKTKLDLNLFYNEDFLEVDALIQKRLRKKKDKGIVLLHGLPGTGKTTYLRYLIGKLKKRILFVSPSVADNIMNPEFIEVLVDNPNCVLVIEDAENIIMDRKYNSRSSVSNLLNISDGLLADFLNVQLICTFNSPLTTVDIALLRPGRLIARYEFGKLGINKSQVLSNQFNMNKLINEPMTIAEILNQEQPKHEMKTATIGFRRLNENVK